ncbi:unnamed protein product [Sphagnum balticum]
MRMAGSPLHQDLAVYPVCFATALCDEFDGSRVTHSYFVTEFLEHDYEPFVSAAALNHAGQIGIPRKELADFLFFVIHSFLKQDVSFWSPTVTTENRLW